MVKVRQDRSCLTFFTRFFLAWSLFSALSNFEKKTIAVTGAACWSFCLSAGKAKPYGRKNAGFPESRRFLWPAE
jgi:hypothetical protein